MLSFDTNILVYASDPAAGFRHAAAAKLLAAAALGQKAVLNEQSLVEFLHVATRKTKLPVALAARLVSSWMKNFPLITASQTVMDDTVALLASYPLSVWDAHMLALCQANHCTALISEDLSDGAVYGTVRVISPFNPRNALAIQELLDS
jgi:predicted nucleic acid-binding protein